MIELPLVFLGGLLGSSHCLGMCGGFALWVGVGSKSYLANLGRQLLYSAGRIFTYACGGAAVGYAGMRLARLAPTLVDAQAVLAILAGCLLIVQGLWGTGLLPRRAIGPSAAGCLAARSLGPLLRGTGHAGIFLAGLFTGFLPCGLVYAYLALATASGGMARGMATMAAFGLGTVPLMALCGTGGTLLQATARRRVFQFAAWCIVLTGVVSLARGASYWRTAETEPAASCPLCAAKE